MSIVKTWSNSRTTPLDFQGLKNWFCFCFLFVLQVSIAIGGCTPYSSPVLMLSVMCSTQWYLPWNCLLLSHDALTGPRLDWLMTSYESGLYQSWSDGGVNFCNNNFNGISLFLQTMARRCSQIKLYIWTLSSFGQYGQGRIMNMNTL